MGVAHVCCTSELAITDCLTVRERPSLTPRRVGLLSEFASSRRLPVKRVSEDGSST